MGVEGGVWGCEGSCVWVWREVCGGVKGGVCGGCAGQGSLFDIYC